MRKFFSWFAFSVRWLLIVMLPLVGMFVGLFLVPQAKPLWELSLDSSFQCAGIISDEEATAIVICRETFYDLGVSRGVVEGYDLKTGKLAFSYNVSGVKRSLLIPGTTFMLTDLWGTLYLIDWKHGTEPLRLPGFLRSLPTNATRKLDVIAKLDLFHVTFWHLGVDPPTEVACDLRSHFFERIDLNQDGTRAMVTFSNDLLAKLSRDNTQLIDTKTGKIAQTLPNYIAAFRWHPTVNSFLALEQKPDYLAWQRYSLCADNTFEPTGSPIPVKRPGIAVKQTDSSLIVLGSSNEEDPRRKNLADWLGTRGEFLLKRFWPSSTTFDLYQPATCELVHSVTVPEINAVRRGFKFDKGVTIHPDLAGLGLIIEDGNTLTYWPFYRSYLWLPWVGLGVGLLGSLLLVWLSVLRARRSCST